MLYEKPWCAQCGDGVSVDEDGCCLLCGGQAVGPGAHRASIALHRATRLESTNAELLAALKDVVFQLDYLVPGGAYLPGARAAIAKAEGK